MCNIGYPSETHLKLKSREISFVHNTRFNCPIVLKFCTEHGNQNDWKLDMAVMNERDFTRFEFKMRFGQISHIAHGPCLMSTKQDQHRVFLLRSVTITFREKKSKKCGVLFYHWGLKQMLWYMLCLPSLLYIRNMFYHKLYSFRKHETNTLVYLCLCVCIKIPRVIQIHQRGSHIYQTTRGYAKTQMLWSLNKIE